MGRPQARIQSPSLDASHHSRQRATMSSIEKTVLPRPAIATTPGISIPVDGALGTAARTRTRARTWILASLLLLLPLFAYFPTTFHDYGLRDDYSNLREAHQERGKILQFCASHARPIYGMLLQATYGQTNSVQNLQWMRFGSALLLGAIAFGLVPEFAFFRLVIRHESLLRAARRSRAVRSSHRGLGDRLALRGDRTSGRGRLFRGRGRHGARQQPGPHDRAMARGARIDDRLRADLSAERALLRRAAHRAR